MRLYIFDMDGTLLPQTTGMLQVAKVMGHTAELQDLEHQLATKQIDSSQFAKEIYSLWKSLPLPLVEQAFNDSPKLANIREALAQIAKEGAVSCLITQSPYFFAQHFHTFGFTHIFASKPFDLQDMQFFPDRVLYAKDKPILAEQLCQQLNFSFAESVAFGDSISDIPLFQTLTRTVSVNGDAALKKWAKYHYEGMDILEALSLIR